MSDFFANDGTNSYVSRPYTTVNVPEPTIDQSASQFVYNYYTRDERVPSSEQDSFSTQNFVSLQTFRENFRSPDTAPPRYNVIIFSFRDPSVGDESLGSSQLIDNFIASATTSAGTINLRPDRILSEGAFSNFYFSSSNLIDTNLDKRFYYFLNNSIYFNEQVTQTDTDQSSAALLDRAEKYLDRNSHNGNNRQLVRQFVGQINRSGQNIINSDTGVSLEDEFMLSVRQQSFLLGFNNLFFDDIILASTDDSASLFEDELRAFRPHSTTVQQKTEEHISPGLIDSETFRDILGLGALYDYKIDETPELIQANSTQDAPHRRHIGFVIQKTELTKSGDIINHPAVFVGRPGATSFVDMNVTYGHKFTYKLRSVFAIEYDFIIRVEASGNNGTGNTTQSLRGLFFVGSRVDTVKLNAFENVPPKPPNALRFNYQRNLGLLIDWDPPHNPQRDIVGYHIYRRGDVVNSDGNLIPAIDQPFTLIKEINFDRSIIKTSKFETPMLKDVERVLAHTPYYLDEEFNNDSSYIYAISTFDAHGMTSNYSPQYIVSYDRPTNKIVVGTVSKEFAPKAYPNMFLNMSSKITDVMQDNIKVSGKKRMSVYFNPDYYHVFKKLTATEQDPNVTGTENLKMLQASTKNEEAVYKIHIINTDLQKDQVVDICIADESTIHLDIPKALIEENNFSFELLHPNKYE